MASGTIDGRRTGAMALLLLAMALHGAVPSAASGAEAALVAGINGQPTLTRAGQTRPLKVGDAVAIGDRVDTDKDSKARILLADDSVLTIGPRTQVTIDELLLGPMRKARLHVLFGRFKLAIAAWLAGPSDYEVDTPTAVAGVRGTVLWGDTELDAICALHGHVEVRTVKGDKTARLRAGQCVTKMKEGETAPLAPSPQDLQKYLREVTLD